VPKNRPGTHRIQDPHGIRIHRRRNHVALQGTIDGFGVVDVLQLLAASHKTGRLVIEGDRGVGQLWVLDGEITAGAIRGEDVGDGTGIVFELLRFGDGSFLFEPGLRAPGTAFEPVPVGDALDEAAERLERWTEIESVVPTARHRMWLQPELPEGAVELSAAEWQVVVAAGAGASVTQLAEVADLDEVSACAAVAAMVGRGLVGIAEPAADADAAPAASEVPALPAAAPAAGDEPEPVAVEAIAAEDPPEPVPVTNASGEPYMAAVLVTEDTSAADAFPERFPIDDLVGSEDDGAWVTLEGEGADDGRFAAAQPFSDAAFSDGGSSDGEAEPAADDGAMFTHPAWNDDAFERFEPAGASDDASPAASAGGAATDAPAAFTDAAFTDPAFTGTAFTDAAFTDTAFTDTAFTDTAFTDTGSADGTFAEGALAHEPGGFTDRGAVTDPVPGATPTVGDGAFLAAEPGATTLVQEASVGAFTPAPDPPSSADTATDEVLKQMSRLSPKAAEAIAAALGSAQEPEPPESDGDGAFLPGSGR
jgi:hypothetical protein